MLLGSPRGRHEGPGAAWAETPQDPAAGPRSAPPTADVDMRVLRWVTAQGLKWYRKHGGLPQSLPQPQRNWIWAELASRGGVWGPRNDPILGSACR